MNFNFYSQQLDNYFESDLLVLFSLLVLLGLKKEGMSLKMYFFGKKDEPKIEKKTFNVTFPLF